MPECRLCLREVPAVQLSPLPGSVMQVCPQCAAWQGEPANRHKGRPPWARRLSVEEQLEAVLTSEEAEEDAAEERARRRQEAAERIEAAESAPRVRRPAGGVE